MIWVLNFFVYTRQVKKNEKCDDDFIIHGFEFAPLSRGEGGCVCKFLSLSFFLFPPILLKKGKKGRKMQMKQFITDFPNIVKSLNFNIFLSENFLEKNHFKNVTTYVENDVFPPPPRRGGGEM